MRWIIDLVFIAIVAVCCWSGYRNGIIRGVCGVLAVIISLYGANIIANVYSAEFSGMIQPFGEGLVDGAVSSVLTDSDSEDEVVFIVPEEDRDDVYVVCLTALQSIGLSESAAAHIAESVAAETDTVNQDMSGLLAEKLCERIAFAGVVAVAFILLAIIFSVIGNLINLTFEIPGIGIAERIGGAVLGLVKGIIIMYALAVLLRYLGMLLPDEIMESNKFLTGIINNNPVANRLGL